MKKFVLALLFLVLLLGGCWDHGGTDPMTLHPEIVIKQDRDMGAWIFGDLKGDGIDQIITTDNSLVGLFGTYIADQQGKIFSQINLRNKVRSMRILEDESTQNRWLFLTYNDQKRVVITAFKYTWGTPLQREDKNFEPIERTDRYVGKPDLEYFALIYPEMITDIDQDGRQDLVCYMLDGFTANPRGLVVFDMDTGRIKWRYDTPCNLSTILFDDFDGNGSGEFIISTMAMKNTSEKKNDLDDFNGYLMVLSADGQKLYQQQLFSDYGQSNLDAADIDQDGKPEIYNLICTWGPSKDQNRISVLQWDGSKLIMIASRELGSSLERTQNTDFVLRKDKKATYQVVLNDLDKKLLVLDSKLNEIKHKYSSNIARIYEIKDMNRDGSKEFLVETTESYIEVINSDFERVARLKNPLEREESYRLMLLNRGPDATPWIAVCSPRVMYMYQLKNQSIGILIWGLLHRYSWIIMLILLVTVIFQIYYMNGARRYFRNTFNVPGVGHIYVQRLVHIRAINQTAWSLADSGRDSPSRDLRVCFPYLHKLLVVFAEGKPDRTTIISPLSEGNPNRYQITIINIPSWHRRDVICIVPIVSEPDLEGDKTQWADTARRLSHHVRRHITNILLALEVMKNKAPDPDGEYLEIIRDEIDKVRIFTHSFQRFTELKNYELQLQDIIPSVEHCLSGCRIPENVKLLKNWTLSSVHARIEPIRFEEALLNMVNNAIDAMPSGGTLQILVKEMPPSAAHFNNLRVLVEIEDTGSGIPAKYLEEIWKPFFTTKQAGTGIGIPESRKIIESMGGTMDIHSEEGVGTTVSFWLKGTEHE